MPIIEIYKCDRCGDEYTDKGNVCVTNSGKVLCENCVAALLGEKTAAHKYHRRRVRDLLKWNDESRYYDRIRDYLRECCEAGKLVFEKRSSKRSPVVVLIYDEHYAEVMQGVAAIDAQYSDELKKELSI